MRSEDDNRPLDIQWLSGEITTPLNMYLLPWIWYGTLAAGALYFTMHFGRFPDLRRLGTFGIVLAALTVFVAWVSSQTKRVGVCDGQLVVSNYRKTILVPYRQVAAVENVWWYWRRTVRIRFRAPTEFGDLVYYIPAYAGLMMYFADPTEELRERIRDHEALAPWHFR